MYLSTLSTIMCSVSEMVLLIDLYLIIRNPFYPREKRMIKYYITFFIGIVCSLILATIERKENFTDSFVKGYDRIREVYWPIAAILDVIVLFIILIKMNISLRGVNKEFTRKVFVYYFVYMVL